LNPTLTIVISHLSTFNRLKPLEETLRQLLWQVRDDYVIMKTAFFRELIQHAWGRPQDYLATVLKRRA
jgi:hypothetical protein